jgi:large conductance mechanosensitive channel
MKKLAEDFKSFLIKGDLVSLAVGLVMALVFAAVVKALIADLITPIIALIFGQPNFSALAFSINSSHFLYGDFINNLITFVTTGAAVFFFVVKPYEAFTARRATGDPTIKQCPECTSEIPAAARRCPMCTAELTAGSQAPPAALQ